MRPALSAAPARAAALLLALAFAAASCGGNGGGDEGEDGLRLAFLLDYTGDLAEWGPAMETGVRLAIDHVNAAGGVLGRPVSLATGDTRLDPAVAIEEARRLVEIEGAHAIIGPIDDALAIGITGSIAKPARIPVISPAATSPLFSTADDDGFLFRTTLSDIAQGEVLADLAEEQGYAKVGVLYVDNPYGQGLSEVFASAFAGESELVAFEYGQTAYLSELQRAAAGGAEALVAIAYPRHAEVFVREAVENGIFSRFLFVDGTKSPDVIEAVGAENLEGMRGTAPIGGPETASLRAWNAAYVERHGALPPNPFVRESYDAAIAIMLAAEAAGSTGGEAIRDRLREIAGPGGEDVIAGAEGIARALELIRDGADVNYEGAGTSVDWNDDGDIISGWIGIWEIRGGEIVELDQRPFTLE